MHTNIKVGTIVNIMKVNSEHLRKIEVKQQKYDYYKSLGNEILTYLAGIELKHEQNKYSEFLDFYI